MTEQRREKDQEQLVEDQALPRRVTDRPGRHSRRSFLKRSGTTAMAAAGAGTITIGTRVGGPAAQETWDATPVALPDDFTPAPPETPPFDSLTFFQPHQAETVEAIAARIIPGDADDPGAREAGVLYYIDHVLANSQGFAEPTYHSPPFAMTYEGDEPPDNGTAEELGYQVIWVHEDEIERYGFQSMLTPREMYERGLEAVDRFANARFESDFIDLSENEQDELLEAMSQDEADEFDDPSGEMFFETIREHTIEGMFCDPAYGGNRDMVGWQLVGFPGAHRAYTVQELRTEGTERWYQDLDELPPFNPGRPDRPEAVMPVRGSDPEIEGREHMDEETGNDENNNDNDDS